MMQKKVKIDETLKVKSFVTLLNDQRQTKVKGGWVIKSLKDDC